MTEANVIDSFSGRYRFLSNFYPCRIVFFGKVWPSSEHLFQALKTNDEASRRRIQCAPRPIQAKHLGRHVKLRHDWEDIKDNVMRTVVQAKFQQNPNLMEKLLQTGKSVLVEGNDWHDNVWGNCTCPRCKDIEGENRLGRALMDLREEFQNRSQKKEA